MFLEQRFGLKPAFSTLTIAQVADVVRLTESASLISASLQPISNGSTRSHPNSRARICTHAFLLAGSQPGQRSANLHRQLVECMRLARVPARRPRFRPLDR